MKVTNPNLTKNLTSNPCCIKGTYPVDGLAAFMDELNAELNPSSETEI
jgi:hypothetical protein